MEDGAVEGGVVDRGDEYMSYDFFEGLVFGVIMSTGLWVVLFVAVKLVMKVI